MTAEKKTNRKNIIRAVLLGFLFIAIFSEGSVLVYRAKSHVSAPFNAQAEADKFTQLCMNGHGDHATCYEDNVPKLLANRSMAQVFDVVRKIREEDHEYGFCHVLGHKIGEQEVSKDPAKWMDVVAQCPSDGLCSNGCGHGAIMTRYRSDGLRESFPPEYIDTHIVPDLAKVCEPRVGFAPSPLDKAICYHGLGHVIDFIADGDVKTALDTCRKVTNNNANGMGRVCLEGVYMQFYQPLEPDDYALVKKVTANLSSGATTSLTIKTSAELCQKSAWSAEEKGACHRESWPLHREQIRTGKGIDEFCKNEVNSAERDKCYETAMTINARFSVRNSGYMKDLCATMSDEHRGRCYDIGSRAIIEEDRTAGADAIAFCSAIANKKDKNTCLDALAGGAKFIFGPGTPLSSSFCAMMPEDKRATCLQ